MNEAMTETTGALPVRTKEEPLRVLIVDDEDGFLQAMKRLFHASGYDAHIARSGLEAIDLVRNHTYDVVCLDLWMPGRNGLDTLQSIRAIDARVPVIMMSGMGTACTKEASEKMGSFSYMQKPFGSDEILRTVESAARKIEEEREMNEAGTGRGAILLADDHESFRATLARRLRGEGFAVDEVGTGAGAIAAWSRRRYDLGLLDMHMPEGSGAEAAQAIHESDPTAVLAFMTGEATQGEINENVRHAIGVCLTKPLSFEKIAQKISFLIDVGRRTRMRQVSFDNYESLTALSKGLHNLKRSARKFHRSGRDKFMAFVVISSALMSLPMLHIADSVQREDIDRINEQRKEALIEASRTSEFAAAAVKQFEKSYQRVEK